MMRTTAITLSGLIVCAAAAMASGAFADPADTVEATMNEEAAEAAAEITAPAERLRVQAAAADDIESVDGTGVAAAGDTESVDGTGVSAANDTESVDGTGVAAADETESVDGTGHAVADDIESVDGTGLVAADDTESVDGTGVGVAAGTEAVDGTGRQALPALTEELQTIEAAARTGISDAAAGVTAPEAAPDDNESVDGTGRISTIGDGD